MKPEEVQQAYAKIQGLPDYEGMDKAFRISDAFLNLQDKPKFFLYSLKRCVVDYYWAYINSLHGWLMPNPQNMIGMQEYNGLTEQQREEAHQLMRDMTKLVRKDLILHDVDKEEESIAFINELYEQWNGFFTTWNELSKHVIASWDKPLPPKEVNHHAH